MATLLHFPIAVQPIHVLPFPVVLPAETGPTVEADEPFHPSPADLAYDLAYAAARIGEPARSPYGAPPIVKAAHHRGTADGTARHEAELEAWIELMERDRWEVAQGGPITDHDMYRPGCVS